MKNKNKNKYNGGAAMMVLVLFFVFISLTILIGVINPTVREFKIASDSFKSKQTYFLAESSLEDVLYRMKNNFLYDTNETLILDGSSASTTVTDIASNQKEIVSLGNTDSLQRRVSMTLNTGVGASFSYGVLVGNGGFVMNNGSKIIGSVYSNGTITGSGSITGSATSANSAALTSDQSNGSGVPPYNIIFGKVSGQEDIAQSFKISNTEVVNKVQLYIKKVGAPSNLTVRIVSDSGGKPSSSTITSGTLSASLVSTNYGWVDVPFLSNPELALGTTYWIVIDGSLSSTKYYSIGGNNNGYIDGIGKIGQYNGTWNNTSPSGLDTFFNLYIGGSTGLISGVTVGQDGIGNTYSHTVNNTVISGVNYCQTGTGNNKACDTSHTDPVQIPMPISEQNILDWKDEAALGGLHSGDYDISTNTILGPKKISGNLTIGIGKKLTLNGVVWVQGNLVMNNNSIMDLASWYGSSDGIIIVDGTITISNNATFSGSGTAGSYILSLTTSSSPSAISLANNAGAVSLYAANGTINVSNNGTAKALTGHVINLGNNAIITYDTGLMNANFVSGPSGSWEIDSWKEIE